MQKSMMDEAVDVLKERLSGAQDLIRENYKGKRQFRFQPIPPREALYKYLTTFDTPEKIVFAQQHFGKDFDIYRMDMEKLKTKMGVQ